MNQAAFIVVATSLYPLTSQEVKVYLEEVPKKQPKVSCFILAIP